MSTNHLDRRVTNIGHKDTSAIGSADLPPHSFTLSAVQTGERRRRLTCISDKMFTTVTKC